MDKDVILEMLEEIKEGLNNPKSPQIDTSAINNLTASLQETTAKTNEYAEQFREILEQVKHPAKTEHRHIIDIQSSWVFFSLIGLSVMLLICGAIIYNQRQTLAQYRDNDLKYRYIKMKGEATPAHISDLETIFEINRDNTRIRQLRRDVEHYDQAIKAKASLDEQARLRQQEAEKLNHEAEIIKKK